MAYKLGVRDTELCGDCPSIALGSNAVTPLEMASVYSTLAAGGIYSKPIAILKVVLANGKTDTDSGWGRPQRQRVIPDWVAAETTKVLEQNMLYGTGTVAYFGRTSAGKTGTTDNFADAWFCGYVPQLETTVWVGYPRGEIPMLSVHGIAVAGATFPSQIWHEYMQAAVGGLPVLDFPQPTTRPVWLPWHGQYEYGGSSGSRPSVGGGYSTSTPSSVATTSTDTASSTQATLPAPTTAQEPTTAPPPPSAPTPAVPPPSIETATTPEPGT
jgi:penicillin-binding protein 1A